MVFLCNWKERNFIGLWNAPFVSNILPNDIICYTICLPACLDEPRLTVRNDHSEDGATPPPQWACYRHFLLTSITDNHQQTPSTKMVRGWSSAKTIIQWVVLVNYFIMILIIHCINNNSISTMHAVLRWVCLSHCLSDRATKQLGLHKTEWRIVLARRRQRGRLCQPWPWMRILMYANWVRTIFLIPTNKLHQRGDDDDDFG